MNKALQRVTNLKMSNEGISDFTHSAKVQSNLLEREILEFTNKMFAFGGQAAW